MKKISLLFSLISPLLLSLTILAQVPQQFNTSEEIDAYKRHIINNTYDKVDLPVQPTGYNPASTLDFDLQLFVELGSNSGLAAVECDGNSIYVGTWNDVTINQYDLSGNLVDSFSIPDVGYYRDFAWDGTFLYATDGTNLIYQIDPDTKTLVGTIITEHYLRGLAYDENSDVFYGCDLSDPIVAIDREGNTLAQYSPGTMSGLYGLAYDGSSPDGPFLWGFSQFSSTFVQYSLPDVTETGNTFSVSDDLGLPASVAGGLALTDNLFPGTVSLVGILQSEAIIAYEAAQTVTFDNDVAVTAIIEPQSGIQLTVSEPVTIRVKNYGINTQSDIPVSFTLDGGAPFTGIIEGPLAQNESVEYTFTQLVDLTNLGTYTFEACVTMEGDENNANDCKTKQVTHLEPSYCIPGSSCTFGDGFESFTLEEIENLNSGCSPGGYGDFTNLTTALQAGETYTVTWSSGYGSNLASLWIDLDRDFEFDEDERLITDFGMDISNQQYQAELTIPEDAPDGETTLRIRANWLNSSADPCMDFSYGETEDYTVFISNTPLANNVGVKTLSLPTVAETGEINPQATVRNYGTEPRSFPVELNIGDYSSSVQVDNLVPGTEIVVNFDTWNAAPGQYEATACTQLEGDEFIGNDCESQEVVIVNSVSAYGYVSYDNTGQFDNSWVAFDVADPGTLLQVGTTTLFNPIVGATWVAGKIYAVDYNGDIYEFDPDSGTQELLWENNPQFFGIAFDGSDFYVSTFDKLYKFDMATGEATLVGAFSDLQYGITSIAFDGNGDLWGVDLANDELRAIDKETAESSVVGALGYDFIYLCDLSFDKTTNVLYFAGSLNSSGSSELYIVNTETGDASPIGQLQNNVHLYALSLTSGAGFMFPPQNLSAAANGNDAILSWSEPFGGNTIEYRIYRDDELIGTTAALEFTDASLEIGNYAYTVTAIYDDGESDPAGPVGVAIGNPELTYTPESIDAVLEMGEATVKQFTVYNNGNLDLDFELTPYFYPQTSSAPPSPRVSKEEFNRLASERFGENWGDLLDDDELISAPAGIDQYCAVSANCNFGDGLTSFKLGEINNSGSGCSPNGYGDFTGITTSLDAGMPYDLTVSSGYPNNVLTVWVDLNQDEIFNEDELLVDGLVLEMAGQEYTTQITIPEGALTGETRLRAIASWINPSLEPCGYQSFAEAEDYTVNISGAGNWILVDPQAGTVAPGDSAVITVTLDAGDLDPIEYMGHIDIATNDTSNMMASIPVNLTVLEQGISNFFPVWETPFNPMSIFVVGARLDSLDLNLGDEIGVFDVDPDTGGEICVGAGLVINPVSPENILEIIVSMDDGSNPDQANGFTPGNEIIYRMWNSLTGEVDDVTAIYPNPGFDETFTPLGTAIVDLDGSAMVPQPLTLTEGWNLISSRAQPYNTNMMTIFQPLINMGVLQKVIDEDGGTMVFLPYPEPEGRWNNSIGEMEMSEGYYVKVTEDLQTSMYGLPVELPMELPLEAGWNIMGYPAQSPHNALEMVDPLIVANNLYKVIDQSGGVIQYVPYPEPNGTWINTIGDFRNGQGYYIRVFDETSLMIEETPGTQKVQNFGDGDAENGYFEPVYQNNPYMPMHFIIYTNNNLEAGDEVAVFDGDVCAGASVYDGNANQMTITVTSMDDPDSEVVDGYISGNNFTVKIWAGGTLYEDVEMEGISGPDTFTPLESYIGEITETITGTGDIIAQDAGLSVFPNPASDVLQISIKLQNPGRATLALYRTDGTPVRQIFNGTIDSSAKFETSVSDIAPGIYLLKAVTDGRDGLIVKKVVIR